MTERATEAADFDSLSQLALNLRCSWNHATDELWQRLDRAQWDLTHNPWTVLQTVSREKLREVLDEPGFRDLVAQLLEVRREAIETPAWFQKAYADAAFKCAAYFSMEYMLSEALPIYSGGLGNVAGDQLKSASDLGVPVVGVGLLYAQGYFRQTIDVDGAQQALFPYNDPGQLPISPLRKTNGEWLRLEVVFPGYSIWLRAWQVEVGRLTLYLLDSNDIANFPAFRGVTSILYGGGSELRLQQELVLGIGGWRLLQALGLDPEVCHLNEGHAAFAVLERARSFMQATGQSFQAALTTTRAGNVFTTHTAVAAGFDCFTPKLIEQYLGNYARGTLKITTRELLALGRLEPDDEAEGFNMAYLALRGSGTVNAVSRLHGRVSRALFSPLFPRWPLPEVPIGHITNGVHTPSWDSAEADALWTRFCGKDRWLGTLEDLPQRVRKIPDSDLWNLRTDARRSLIDCARARLSTQLATSGMAGEKLDSAKHLFSDKTLTLGFARRFATYKRPNLLLKDPDRLLRLLSNPERPVQLLLAGKAHPADAAGQLLIQEWIRFIRQPEVSPHVMFLTDYDMLLTERLVEGVDVWINTPARPWEACGTSGMKVLVNGGLNLSELDGWWAEAYAPDIGWALGAEGDPTSDAETDANDATQLFEILEHQVIPEFYDRDANGIPAAWIARIRESMATLTTTYSANRSVREYVDRHYAPAAASFRSRAANQGALGRQMNEWQDALDADWHTLKIGRVGSTPNEGGYEFKAEVTLGKLSNDAVQVQLYADEQDRCGAGYCRNMDLMDGSTDSAGHSLYIVNVPKGRAPADYTVRVIPSHRGVAVPLESRHITWQR